MGKNLSSTFFWIWRRGTWTSVRGMLVERSELRRVDRILLRTYWSTLLVYPLGADLAAASLLPRIRYYRSFKLCAERTCHYRSFLHDAPRGQVKACLPTTFYFYCKNHYNMQQSEYLSTHKHMHQQLINQQIQLNFLHLNHPPHPPTKPTHPNNAKSMLQCNTQELKSHDLKRNVYKTGSPTKSAYP